MMTLKFYTQKKGYASYTGGSAGDKDRIQNH